MTDDDEKIAAPANDATTKTSPPDGGQPAEQVLQQWLELPPRDRERLSITEAMCSAGVSRNRQRAVLADAVQRGLLERESTRAYYKRGEKPQTPYERALRAIERLVEGMNGVGGRLPTALAVGESWHINVGTVGCAYHELEKRGWIENYGPGTSGGWYTVGPEGPPSRFVEAKAAARGLRETLRTSLYDGGSQIRKRPAVIEGGASIPSSADAVYPELVERGNTVAGLTPIRFAPPIPFVMIVEQGQPVGLLYLGGWVLPAGAIAAWISDELALDQRLAASGWAIELPPEIPNATTRVSLAVLKIAYWQHDPGVLAWADEFHLGQLRTKGETPTSADPNPAKERLPDGNDGLDQLLRRMVASDVPPPAPERGRFDPSRLDPALALTRRAQALAERPRAIPALAQALHETLDVVEDVLTDLPASAGRLIVSDDLQLDLVGLVVTHRGEAREWSPKPFAVLAALARDPGKLRTKEELIVAAWGAEAPPSAAGTICHYVYSIRKWIGDGSVETVTASGKPAVGRTAIGYRLTAGPRTVDSATGGSTATVGRRTDHPATGGGDELALARASLVEVRHHLIRGDPSAAIQALAHGLRAALAVFASARRWMSEDRAPALIVNGDIRIEVNRIRVTRAGEVVSLAQKQFLLLVALAARPGEVRTSNALIEAVWGAEAPSSARMMVTQHIGCLRAQLGDDAIVTGSVGYRFREERHADRTDRALRLVDRHPRAAIELLAEVLGDALRAMHASEREDEYPRIVVRGELRIDLDSRKVTQRGELVAISEKPLALLIALAGKRGVVCARAELIEAVWGPDVPGDPLAGLGNYVWELRKRLGSDAIDSALPLGYRLA